MDQAVEFPVVLYNGERQVSVGKIVIHPAINFQEFRTTLKQMIGISYNNLTTYLVENRTPRKILITSKVDFMVLMQEKNAYFLVVLKRSRRDRRRKSYRQNHVELSPADLFDYGLDYPRYNDYEIVTTHNNIPDYSSKVEYWLHDQLEMEKGKHNNNMMHDNNLNKDFGSDDANFPSISEAYPTVERLEPPLETHPRAEETRALCEDCMQANKKGVKPEFHLCVYDEVVEGFFKSPAGPICRPM